MILVYRFCTILADDHMIKKAIDILVSKIQCSYIVVSVSYALREVNCAVYQCKRSASQVSLAGGSGSLVA